MTGFTENVMESQLSESDRKFWEAYLATLPAPLESPNVHAAWAGDARNTDELLQLYLVGKKSAGSSLLEDYRHAGDPLQQVGNFWIVLNGQCQPACILKTVRITKHKFKNVPQEIATAEGEGDLSLRYWREAHMRFFEPYLSKWNVADLEETTVITEFFELVYRG